jgi:hypothetical protein
MQETVSKVKNGLVGMYHLARALPDFFRERITVEQAEEEIKKALERRSETFLELARTLIYGNPASPYLRLLKIAACEFSDLRSQVLQYGLEQTLERLAREGVYLTSEEFRGTSEVVRGRDSFRCARDDFRPAPATAGFGIQSSGTTHRPVSTMTPLAVLSRSAFTRAVFSSAHDLGVCSHGMFDAILPAAGALANLLTSAKAGIRFDRWFARRIPVNSRIESAYHYLVTHLIVVMGKLYSPGFPMPEFLDGENIAPILRWIVDQRRLGQPCCITTAAGNAVRIARAALESGVALDGVKFILMGEPFTEAKREVLQRAGASATSRYAFSGGGNVGYGCARPLHADEVHVNQHMLALVEQPTSTARHDAGVRPFLFTTFDPSRLLFNVQNGDYGVLETRDCGCALGKVGLTLHLHHIRSFEKFTSEGMNYFYGDLYEFFEKTLPAEFGGGPGDYQIVEEEDENGQTRLTLRAHPQIGAIDEPKLLGRLRDELARRSWSHEFQTRIWARAGTLRVKREPPFASARGKILPLHIRR